MIKYNNESWVNKRVGSVNDSMIKLNSRKFMFKKKFKNMFTRNFLSLFIIVFTVMAVVSLTIYYKFSNATIEDIGNNTQEKLNENMKQLNFMKTQMMAIGIQLLNDSAIVNSIHRVNTDASIKYLAQIKLIQTVDTNPMIDSIYAFNSSTKEYVSNLSSTGSGTALDKVMELTCKNYTDENILKFLPISFLNKTSSGDEKIDHIISIIFVNFPHLKTSNTNEVNTIPNDMLIINFKADVIQSFLTSISDTKNSETFIINNHGQVICDSNMENFGHTIKNIEYIDRIIKSDKQEGHLVENDDNGKFLITYKTSDSNQYIFVNKTNYSILLQKIYALRSTIIMVYLLVLVLCIIIYILISRSEHLKNAPFIKKMLLRLLLQGDKVSSANAYNKINEVKLNIDNASSLVILFSIAECAETFKIQDNSSEKLLISQVQNIIESILSNDLKIEIIDMDQQDLIAAIVNIIDQEGFQQLLKERISKIQDKALNELGVNIAASIGLRVENIDRLHLSYSNCTELLRYRFVYGHKSILDNTIINETINNRITPIDKNKKKIIQDIKECNIDGIESEVNKVFTLISDNRYDYIRLTINQLALDIIQAVEALIKTENIEIDFGNIYADINNLQTIKDVKMWFINFSKDIVKKLESKKFTRQRDTINLVISYINDNYFRPDLSAESVSEIVKLSSGYLGKLFSEYTGKSLNEYINSLRMDNAKELLIKSSFSINDISTKVGFSNQSYFTSIFKKYFGITPNQYRLNHRKEI